MTACSYALYELVLYYHCPTDINGEIKELFNFSLCKLTECKMRRGVNWQEVFKHPVHMLHRYLYYYSYSYCLIDIKTEVKEVIFNFSPCKVSECKLRSGVNWQEMFKLKRHKTRPGYICNKLLSIQPTNRMCSVSPVVCLLKLICSGSKNIYREQYS